MIATGADIRRIRISKNLTQRDLAKKSGIAEGTMSKIERKKDLSRSSSTPAIVKALGAKLEPELEKILNEKYSPKRVILDGNKVRSVRLLRGLTMKELGDLVGIHYHEITYLEHNRPVRIESAKKVCQELGIDFEKISELEPPKKPRIGQTFSIGDRVRAKVYFGMDRHYIRLKGTVIEKYPKFVLVNFGKFRECFDPNELERVKKKV